MAMARSACQDDALEIEILPPDPALRAPFMLCDCCRQQKPAGCFDEDSCGLCMDCLECDSWLVESDPAHSRHSQEIPGPATSPSVADPDIGAD